MQNRANIPLADTAFYYCGGLNKLTVMRHSVWETQCATSVIWVRVIPSVDCCKTVSALIPIFLSNNNNAK
jgi:hypothetical protein